MTATWRDQTYYLTGIMPCPYLPDRQERKIFTRLARDAQQNLTLHDALTARGFRRSHDVIYRPACPACQACIPVRVPVAKFQPSRTQRRIAARAAHFLQAIEYPPFGSEFFPLFEHYQQQRHTDGDMARMDAEAFAAMVREGADSLLALTLRDPETLRLVGVMLADALPTSLSAVYSFFAADQPRLSLGTALILRLLDYAQARNLTYVYLGYWVTGSQKMSYKSQFRPQEQLTDTGWIIAEYTTSD
jgi:leucyl-tRNA---protein transferase